MTALEKSPYPDKDLHLYVHPLRMIKTTLCMGVSPCLLDQKRYVVEAVRDMNDLQAFLQSVERLRSRHCSWARLLVMGWRRRHIWPCWGVVSAPTRCSMSSEIRQPLRSIRCPQWSLHDVASDLTCPRPSQVTTPRAKGVPCASAIRVPRQGTGTLEPLETPCSQLNIFSKKKCLIFCPKDPVCACPT